MNKELASIIYTVYNQAQYVRDSLLSAFSQTYEPLEIVVSDDGSTDGTRQVIDELIVGQGFCATEPCENLCVRKFVKGRVSLIVNYNKKNLGICSNYEHAFGLTHGDLVFTFGGDDVSLPNRVEVMMSAWITGGKKAKVLASGGWLIDLGGREYKEWHREVLRGAPIGAFNAYARCVFDNFPRIMPEIAVQAYEDSIYGPRAQFFSSPQYVDELLVRYRFGSGVSTGGGYRKKMMRGARAVKASCGQLIRDLESMHGILTDGQILEKKNALVKQIAHERAFLRLLDGDSIKERWHGFITSGYSKLPLRLRLLGIILLFPCKLSDGLIGFVNNLKYKCEVNNN